jgi:hypothetical protein
VYSGACAADDHYGTRLARLPILFPAREECAPCPLYTFIKPQTMSLGSRYERSGQWLPSLRIDRLTKESRHSPPADYYARLADLLLTEQA